jgi:hypothetical protein
LPKPTLANQRACSGNQAPVTEDLIGCTGCHHVLHLPSRKM